jgi:hypothetical protein
VIERVYYVWFIDKGFALQAVATMMQGQVIDWDGRLALAAVRTYQATVWTRDNDFEGLSA